jgi:hypothetical protein
MRHGRQCAYGLDEGDPEVFFRASVEVCRRARPDRRAPLGFRVMALRSAMRTSPSCVRAVST